MTMNDALIRNFTELLGAGNVLQDEPMSAHTSFRVGGPADVFLRVGTAGQLRAVLALLRETKGSCYLLGRGTNLLVGDGGYRGTIIAMADTQRRVPGSVQNIDSSGHEPADSCGAAACAEGTGRELSLTGIAVSGTRIVVGAGETLAAAAAAARDHGLTGLEFASGIPGSVGGALVMNAGAYGGSMDQVVESVTLLLPDGSIVDRKADEMRFGYRYSLLKECQAAALSAVLRLQEDDPARIDARMRQLSLQRREKQPLEYPSAGSTFKRPKGYYAGKLIMDAGLRGYQVGGAAVSEKHCGFVINRGNATASDVRAVIREVRRRVKENTGVDLEEEVISLGDFGVWQEESAK